MACGLLQFEIDIHRVFAPAAEARGERVDLGNTLRRLHHGIVHDDVAAAAHDFDIGDGTILLDTDLYGADEVLRRVEDRGRLLPLAVETVVDQFVIPAELRGVAASASWLPG